MKTIAYLPMNRTPIIGRETPELTFAMFRGIAQKAAKLAAKRQRRADLVRKLKCILTLGLVNSPQPIQPDADIPND